MYVIVSTRYILIYNKWLQYIIVLIFLAFIHYCTMKTLKSLYIHSRNEVIVVTNSIRLHLMRFLLFKDKIKQTWINGFPLNMFF
jgi:hypothetical protein